jgi:hypothetical protein
MRKLLLIMSLASLWGSVYSQPPKYVYTIKADSVKITNCDSAELIIENHTQGIPGFLFNTGNGRTIFKRGVQKLNDSLYLIGIDTLKVLAINANNGITLSGSTVQLGGDLVRNTAINQHQDSLVLITPDGSTLVQQDSALQPVILPGNTDFGEIPMVKRSKRTGYIVEENAVSVDASASPAGDFLYSRQVVNETVPSGVNAAAFGSGNSFFSELIQGSETGTVLNWHVAGPASLRGRSWNTWITLVNYNNPVYGGNALPFVCHSIPLYVTPAKNAYSSFSTTALSVGSTFAVDADALPLYFVDMPGTPLDTVNNKPLVINPSTGAVQYSYWPSAGGGAFNDNIRSSLTVNGPIKAKQLVLSPDAWADFVFDSTYRLPALDNVEAFIRRQHHLPGIPSAAEVRKDGLDVGAGQAALLKKIEELTLYNIDQEKRINEQYRRLEVQEKELALVKAEIAELKESKKNK